MLLGKRARPSMRRTTSMTGLTVDPINMETSSLPPLDPSINDIMALRAHHHHLQNNINKQQVSVGVSDVNIIDHGFVHHHLSRRNTVGGGDAITSNSEFEQKFMSSDNVVAPPKPRLNQRRNSGDFSVETAHFLRSCGLCKRRLAPGRDIFMYRGDTAFCSLECRQQQIQHDDKKEKCSRVAKKEIPTVVPMATLAGLESSNNGETVALAAA